jgi:hypothetical protein
MIACGSLEKLPQRISHRICFRADGFRVHRHGRQILAVCCNNQRWLNAFQISAGAMSSDPGDLVFLQELRRNFAHLWVFVTKLRDAVASFLWGQKAQAKATEIMLQAFPIAH